jgi:trimeric autotransporter adhesin
MQNLTTRLIALCIIICAFLTLACKQSKETEYDRYDEPAGIAREEFEKTKDPELGYVPTERLVAAIEYAKMMRVNVSPLSATPWSERGPYVDTAGPSGNSRPNNDRTSGRIRAVWVDLTDPTGNTVWVGGVAGGLWKTTSINTNPANWTPINDFFNNMAVTGICQNPANTQIMYFCTGEGFFNFDAVRGAGVWKSTNGGSSWTYLATTSSYTYGTKIVCDAAGNVYLGTRSNGLLRSTDGGSTWTPITPTGMGAGISDIEYSSTGRLHIAGSHNGTPLYRYSDAPATVTSATWTAPTTAYPVTGTDRCELACSGNTLLALPNDAASDNVLTIYKSTDGGVTWAATGTTPGFGSGQGWYCLAAAIDPSNSNNMVVGSLDCYKTTNGGTSWTKISTWAAFSGQYVHADQHEIIWQTSNRLIFACDGGIHYTSDGGTTIRDRNVGLRLKQFFSVAIHPTTTNYFLAGAQDNGSHRLRNAGLGGSVEVTGGDGAYVHIDQDQPLFQWTSYVRNQYRRSTDGGNTWTSINISSSLGQFINPTDYDDAANIMYCSNSAGTYRRWTDPQSGSTSASITIPELNGSNVWALTVSPFTSNRLFLGTAGGRVVRIDNANTIASGSAGTNITSNLATGTINCINFGTTENNIIISSSSFGVQQVWISSNGGTTWTNVDGNLPDMPVRWCMYAPDNNNKAILATDAGVWVTSLLNGSSTVWVADGTFPTVRTDMLQYRASDKLVAAATHGRGLWTQSLPVLLPTLKATLQGKWVNSDYAELNWKYDAPETNVSFELEAAPEGQPFVKIGSTGYKGAYYSMQYRAAAPRMLYRVKVKGADGSVQYSNLVLLRSNDRKGNTVEIAKLYPNPVKNTLSADFRIPGAGTTNLQITDMNGRWLWKREEVLSAAGQYNRSIDVSGLKPGVYVLTLRHNGVVSFQRFVKE